ncbi:19074_t:CDS:2 [Cetraspora pellucida]|uniref:19074_t:CDS:1 n=1 Tax=Cetraspora pellucida TaxID=1433469 RepID=A0A9N9DK06_9GLOM|nr:19074_t:CDS:2 [Cetraspora pellucida]
MGRGEAYHCLERYDEALVDLNKALEIEPDDPTALYYRGRINLMRKKFEGLVDVTRAMNIEPKLKEMFNAQR